MPDTLLREQLLDVLDRGAQGPLTLLLAPAGWGKSALLTSWIRERRGADPPPYLVLGPHDDAGRLWSLLRAALDLPVEPGAVPAGGADGGAAEIAAALAARSRPVTLVLDDLHQLADPHAAAGLDHLLRHGGGGLRLIVATRAEPPLGLARLRVAGALTELGSAHLAFTEQETATLFADHGVTLTDRQLHRLRDRAEGWPAPLRLAALTLAGHPDPDGFVAGFGGEQPEIAAYLREEILAGLAGPVREALPLLTLTAPITAELLDELTGGDGETLLAEVSRHTGLVRPHPAPSPHWRCHRLLADLLRGELRRTGTARLRELHGRTAGWHLRHGRYAEALRHALAAGQWSRAGSLLTGHWAHLLPYQPAPGAVVPVAPGAPADAAVTLALAAERLAAGDLAAGTAYLAQVARGPAAAALRGPLAALDLAAAQLAGDLQRTDRAAARLLAQPPAATPSATNAANAATATATAPDVVAVAVAAAARGLVRLAHGDLPAAGVELDAGLVAAEAAELPRLRLVCAARGAVLHAAAGELAAAERAAAVALALLHEQVGDPADAAHAYLARALTAWHRYRPAEAEANLDRAGELPPATAVLAAEVRARLAFAAGDPDGAVRTLRRAREAAGRLPALRERLCVAEADLRRRRSDLAGVRALLRPSAATEPTGMAAVVLARAEAGHGDLDTARRLLPAWDGPGAGPLNLAARLEAGLVQALIAHRGADARGAARALERVLALAAPQQHRQIFGADEPQLRELLTAHLDSGTAYWSFLDELPARRGGAPAQAEAPGVRPAEPLTERELMILRYLQSILSNVEIANEVSLSVNTVKTHVRNIYRKLQVTRRREAVRRARELRLI